MVGSKRSVREAETAKKGSNLPPSVKATNSAYDDTPKGASRIISGWKFQSTFRESGRTNSEDIGDTNKKSNLKNNESNLKLKNQLNTNKGKEKEKLPKILPNETLGDFNRRIEEILRPSVNKAIKEAASLKALEESNLIKEKKFRKKQIKLEKLIKEGKLPKESLEKFLLEKKEKEKEKEKSNKRKRLNNDNTNEEEEEEDKFKNRKPIKEFKELEKPRRLNDIVQEPPQLPHLRKSSTKIKSNTSSKERYEAVGKNSDKIPLNAGQKRILDEERERVVKMYRELKAKKEEERVNFVGKKL
uniref:Uncharacterized protein n=1 Tax=Kwoniella pini CBS 10737 TaxID=1296096 RepID=A0A1B9I6I6_9TREE|nr:uncharacterized protein I206_03165 [Kwoniella pini CBS 10737]OCF51099.1 hypothetical protein I206_03165 [Kwoniella pini CBS 10737]